MANNSSRTLAACVALIVGGCSGPTAPLPEHPPIPANLTSPCPPLELLSDGIGGTVLRWSTASVAAYNECAANHDNLIKAVTK